MLSFAARSLARSRIVVAPSAAVLRSAVSGLRFASSGIFYTKSDEYVRVEGTKGTCGISNYAQGQLGDVVYVGLPKVGDSFTKG